MTWCWLFGWLGLVGISVFGQNPEFGDFNSRTGIVYKTVNGEALDMALIMPTVKKYERAPVMIFTHGGGWAKGDKTKVFLRPHVGTLEALADNGIACATIEYRLTRPGISTAYDCVVDCKDAARFLVKHADEYGLDPDRMGLWGDSAGGHLCLMTGLADNDLFPGAPELAGYDPAFRCIASYYPATTFLVPEVFNGSNFRNPNRFIPFLGGTYEEKKDLVALLSPTEYLTPASPPVLILYGDKDAVLSFKNATYMQEVGKEKGASVEVLRVVNGGHSFVGNNLDPTITEADILPGITEINQIAAEFIMKHLTPPKDAEK